MQSTPVFIFRLAAGCAVGFWGLSKLFFANNWVGPYEAFYGALPLSPLLLVYLLGIIQLIIAIAIIANFYRKPAAWIAIVFAVVNLAVSLSAVLRPENPILANPAPLGIKLIWFFFNPIAILLLLIGTAMLPESAKGNQLRDISE